MMHSHRLRSGLVGIVAIVMLGVAACSSGDSTETTAGGQETVSSTTAPAGSSETTAATTTTEAPAIGWVRVSDEDGVFGGDDRQAMLAVAAAGPGVVAVGVDGFGGGAIWTSPDGFAWIRVPDEEKIFSSESSTTVNAVVAGGPGVVAVGANEHGAAVWTSSDGTTWNVISGDDALAGHREMRGIVATDAGFIAVGQAWAESTGNAAAVWTSPDGITWTILPDTDQTRPTGAQAHMDAIVAGGPGFVAVGSAHGHESEDNDAAVWTSPDGSTWTRVQDDGTIFGGPGDQWLAAVTVGGPGLVAVGQDYADPEAGAAVWTSSDGLIWTRIPSTLETFGGSDARIMEGVIADGDGFVAVGAVGSGSAVWTSSDGATWTQEPGEAFERDSGNMFGIAHAGPGLVVVGQEYSSDTPDAAVWVKPTSD